MNSLCVSFRTGIEGFSSAASFAPSSFPRGYVRRKDHGLLEPLRDPLLVHGLGESNPSLPSEDEARGFFLRVFSGTTLGRWSYSQKERVELIATPGFWEISIPIQ